MSYSTVMARLRAADPPAPEASRMCAAQGCPNVWSLDAGSGKLCSAHFQAEPREWPEITQRQQWLRDDRSIRFEQAPDSEPVLLTRADAAEIAERLDQLYQVMRTRRPLLTKAWARVLEQRELRGDVLTIAQRRMWRAALSRPAATEPARGAS